MAMVMKVKMPTVSEIAMFMMTAAAMTMTDIVIMIITRIINSSKGGKDTIHRDGQSDTNNQQDYADDIVNSTDEDG